MAQSVVLVGADIILYINNKEFPEVRSLTFTIDYNEQEIYQIDSPWPAEIASTRVSTKGSVTGLRIKNSGGLQGKNLRPLFSDIASSPYISIRVQDRQTKEDIIYITQAKVTRETHTAAAKGVYSLNFDFVGMQPLMALDRA